MIKIMMRFFRRHPWRVTATCALEIGMWGLQALVQVLMIRTFAAAIALDFRRFLAWTAASAATWALYMGTMALLEAVRAQTLRHLNGDVRDGILRGMICGGHTAFHARDVGERLGAVTAHVEKIEELVWMPFFEGVGRIAQIVLNMAILAAIHWALWGLALLSTAIMLLLPKAFSRRMEAAGAARSESQSRSIALLRDLLMGFDIFLSFGTRRLFLARGASAGDVWEAEQARYRTKFGLFEGGLGMANVLLQIAADVLIVYLAVLGKLSVAVISGGTNLMGGITNAFDSLSRVRLSLDAGKPYLRPLEEEVPPFGDPMEARALSTGIALRDVGYRYGERRLFSGVSAEIRPGEKIALQGASGTGKSTLLGILMGWRRDFDGAITLDGRDLREMTEEEHTAWMSYIPQDVYLIGGTIRENILLGDAEDAPRLRRAVRESAMEDMIARLPEGLDTDVGEGGRSLSGGERQRVAIARALYHGRSVLLVDEGTSALDRENADLIERHLLENPDITLLLVSHHLDADRLARFDGVLTLRPHTEEFR